MLTEKHSVIAPKLYPMKSEQTEQRHRFIPFRKIDLLEMCLQGKKLGDQEQEFRSFYKLLTSIFHFEFHQIIESLKNAYATIDPDTDTRTYNEGPGSSVSNFVELLEGLLEKANYERITQAELNSAMAESSLFKIRLHVDFDAFSEVLFFCRGVSTRTESLSRWWGLSSQTISFTNYDRAVVYIRFKDTVSESMSMEGQVPGSTLLKLFRNVPKADLEMLFPNTQIRMRTLDKLLIGIPALISGTVVLTTKLGASLIVLGSLLGFWLGWSSQPVELTNAAIMAIVAGLGALAGYLWKQFTNFKNRKLRFMQALTQNLYFKNLDNNAGVIHRLSDDAEEEECKEALLAFYFLTINGKPLSSNDLDRQIEQWLGLEWQCSIDFEIDDALHKLLALKLITQSKGLYAAVPLKNAIRLLDQRWDNYFVATPE